MIDISPDEAKLIEKIRLLDLKANEALRVYLDGLIADKTPFTDAGMRPNSGLGSEFVSSSQAIDFTKEDMDDFELALEDGNQEVYMPTPVGEPSWRFIQDVQALNFSLDDVEAMARAIEAWLELPSANFDTCHTA